MNDGCHNLTGAAMVLDDFHQEKNKMKVGSKNLLTIFAYHKELSKYF